MAPKGSLWAQPMATWVRVICHKVPTPSTVKFSVMNPRDFSAAYAPLARRRTAGCQAHSQRTSGVIALRASVSRGATTP